MKCVKCTKVCKVCKVHKGYKVYSMSKLYKVCKVDKVYSVYSVYSVYQVYKVSKVFKVYQVYQVDLVIFIILYIRLLMPMFGVFHRAQCRAPSSLMSRVASNSNQTCFSDLLKMASCVLQVLVLVLCFRDGMSVINPLIGLGVAAVTWHAKLQSCMRLA